MHGVPPQESLRKACFTVELWLKTRHTTSQMFDLHDGAALIIQKGIMVVRGITGNGHKHPFVIPKAKQ